MKVSRIQKLLCVLLIAVMMVQGSAVAFAASPYLQPQFLKGGVPDEDGNWTAEYWADADGNRVEQTTARVRAATALPSKYDLRDQGLVTPIKNQAAAGNCWAFAAIASLESSYVRQGYGTVTNTDFSEAHLVWFAQRQRTTDKKDPTYGDGLECEKPYETGGNWYRASATLMRGVGLQLEKNAPWIVSYNVNELMKMQQPESARYVSYARMWGVQSVRDKSASAFKEKIMQNGAATLSYYDDKDEANLGFNAKQDSYYQTAKVGVWNHSVTVVGWDDNYSRYNFNASRRPSSNGAWLIKGSWGSTFGNNGYYWLSYEDPSISEMASYIAAPADVYDYIYQYDGARTNMRFPIPTSGKMANVFTAQRNELLTHVAFYSPNEVPVKATAEVYVMPIDEWYTGAHPTRGMNKIEAATTTVRNVEYGYTTIELANPTPLPQGSTFTVVVTLESENPTQADGKVYIPVEGETVSPPRDGIETYSGSVGDSFLGYNNMWFDTNQYGTKDYNNVPLKAMTRGVTLKDPVLAVDSVPHTTTYRVGDAFDPSGLSLEYTSEFGLTEIVTEGFTCEPETLNEIGTQTVTVTYKDAGMTFEVTVEPYETKLSLETQPQKTTYMVGDAPDTTGLSLQYTDEYNRVHTVTEGFTCEPKTLNEIGKQTVTVTYKGLSLTFDVTTEAYEPTLTLLTVPDRTAYRVRDTLDTAGLSLLYTDKYNKTHVVNEGYVCSPQTISEIGTQTVTVTYGVKYVTFDVTVEPFEPTLTLQAMPFRTAYFYGETLDTRGLSLVYTDEYGDALAVTEGFTCDVETLSVFGTQIVTVTYKDLCVTFDVTVEPYEPTLALVTPPVRTTYLFGEQLDTDGLVLLYKDEYGQEHTVTEGYTCDIETFDLFDIYGVTVTYNDLCVTFDVTVKPHEPTLTLLTEPDKTTYFASEPLDTTGLSLMYTDEFGSAFTVSEGFVCTPEILRALGTQTVRVTYNGLSVTFDVTVEPLEPTLTMLTAPEKTAYLIGEVPNTQGLTLLYTDEIGDALVVTEGFVCDPEYFSSVGDQIVTVTYSGLIVTFDVTVELREPTLTILQMPDVTRYFEGDTLDMKGLTLVYSDEYGSVSVVIDGFAYDVVTFSNLGYQTVTVTYNDLSVSFEIKVVLTDPTLELVTTPSKTTYLYGERLDTTGLTLLYTDDFGVEEIVTENFVCTPETLSALGTQTVEAGYLGLTVSFDVTVEPLEPTLTMLTAPKTTTYMYGDTLDTEGLTLVYTDEYGDALVVSEGFVCEPTALFVFGTQTVTATYNELSVTFDVTVRPHEPTLTLVTPPDNMTYLVGELFDPTGMVLRYTDEYNEEYTVTFGYVYDLHLLDAIGTQTVTVTYSDSSVTLDVTVEPYETTLTLVTMPEKMTYMVGEALDTAGLTLLYSDEYNELHTVSDGYVCSPQTLRTIGTQTVRATYGAKSVTFDVTVEPYEPTLMLLNVPIQTTYFYGETLDTTGLSLIYTDEYNDTFAVTEGFDCDVETLSVFGTQTVTVTYNELSVTFDVTVVPYEPTLTLVSPPDKTVYLYGETIDTTGLSLQYRDEYGVTHSVTEGFDCNLAAPDAFGRHILSVTYNELSVTFEVTVEPHEPTLTLVTAPDKTVCFAAQSPDLTGMSLVYTDAYGASVTVTEGFTFAPEVFHELGAQIVTVSYAGLSVTFDVTVEPIEPTLTLQFTPTKTSYLTGEMLDTQGLTLFYTDERGDALIVTEGFTCDPEQLRTVGEQTVTVMFRGLLVTFDVTVEARETSLVLKTLPQKTTYLIGERLETAGLTLEYTDMYDETHTLRNGFTCDPTVLTSVGTQTVTVTYSGLSVTFDVTVGLYTPTLAIQTLPQKTTYFVGETLDTAGLALSYMDVYGKRTTVTEDFVCSPQTLQNSGQQTVRVSYADLSVTFSVTVRTVEPVSLTVVSAPSNGTYTYKSTPDFSGLTVSVRYNDGHEETVRDLSKMTIQAESNNRVRRGTRTYRVTAQGVSATFTMQVRLAVWQWLILIFLFGWIWY